MILENWEQTLRFNELLFANFTQDTWSRTKEVEDLPEAMDEETVERAPDLWDERL